MKRKKDNTQLILMGLIIVIAVLATGYQTGALKLGCLTCAGGFTVNSISATKIISNDADLQTANFIITVTANGGGQSISGTIDPATIKSWTGLDVTIPISIEMNGITETLNYPIRNEGSIYEYPGVFSAETSNPLANMCMVGYEYCFGTNKWAFPLPVQRTLNVKKAPTGSVGSLDNPTIHWSGTLTYKIAGIPYAQNVDSNFAYTVGSASAAQDFYIGSEWLGNSKWTGSLITGEATPQPSLYKAIYNLGSANWRISPTTYYTKYHDSELTTDLELNRLKEQNTLIAQACRDWECTVITSVINMHQATVDTLKVQNARITYTATTGESISQTTGSMNGVPTIVETSSRRITNPQLVFTVRAKSLGVVIPVGKPGELSATSPSFSSGDNNGVITVQFKNIGTGTGTFAATFTDPSGTFTMASNTEATKTTVAAGGTGSITLYVSHGTNAQPTTKTATVRVYDYNKPSNYAETTVGITMTQPKSCAPGAQRTSGEVMYTCNSDGLGETITLDCTYSGGLTYSSQKYSCKNTGTAPVAGTGAGIDSAGNRVYYGRIIDWYNTPQAALLFISIAALIIVAWRIRNER